MRVLDDSDGSSPGNSPRGRSGAAPARRPADTASRRTVARGLPKNPTEYD